MEGLSCRALCECRTRTSSPTGSCRTIPGSKTTTITSLWGSCGSWEVPGAAMQGGGDLAALGLVLHLSEDPVPLSDILGHLTASWWSCSLLHDHS